VATRAVAKKFTVSRDAAWRHLKRHVSPERRAQLVAGPLKLGELAEKATAEGTTLIGYLSMIRSVLMARFLAAAETGDNPNTALLGGKLTEVLRLIAQTTGELARATSTINNNTLVMASPLMSELQQMLLTRLRPHPEALRTVIEGLEQLSAKTIQTAAPAIAPRLVGASHA
jgi:hypothetical protein